MTSGQYDGAFARRAGLVRYDLGGAIPAGARLALHVKNLFEVNLRRGLHDRHDRYYRFRHNIWSRRAIHDDTFLADPIPRLTGIN